MAVQRALLTFVLLCNTILVVSQNERTHTCCRKDPGSWLVFQTCMLLCTLLHTPVSSH